MNNKHESRARFTVKNKISFQVSFEISEFTFNKEGKISFKIKIPITPSCSGSAFSIPCCSAASFKISLTSSTKKKLAKPFKLKEQASG